MLESRRFNTRTYEAEAGINRARNFSPVSYTKFKAEGPNVQAGSFFFNAKNVLYELFMGGADEGLATGQAVDSCIVY